MKSKSRTASESKPVQPKKKHLNSVAYFYSILGLAVIGFLILYGAGTFDSPTPAQTMPQSPPANQNNPHQGVDLKSLEEINRLQKIVDENPNDLDSKLKLAHLLNDSKFYQKAIETYKSYLTAKPNSPDVIVDMGVCYFELKEYDTAISTMKKALDIDPKHQIALFNIGIVNFSADRPNEAKEWWKKAVDIDPNTNVGQKSQELINSY